jgi:hypothetical protein
MMMTQLEDAKGLIIRLVNVNAPLTLSKLVIDIYGLVGPSRIDFFTIEHAMYQLLVDKEIVGMEFIDPENKRVIPLLFRKGTILVK